MSDLQHLGLELTTFATDGTSGLFLETLRKKLAAIWFTHGYDKYMEASQESSPDQINLKLSK